ncbi:MAG: transferase, partial [Ignavibacteriaceae bacterium]|nr:transferase [Ignavibacteriaceae bacterium]
TIIHDKTIGENCLIGSGSVVTKNLLEAGTYIGIPAAKIN